MIPAKLKRGDKVAVIAPARSLAIIGREVRKAAIGRLGELGLEAVFSRHAEEMDDFNSSSVRSRLEDLHWAFENKEFKAVFTAIGGFNSNQLLSNIDYSLIKSNPKIFCGYSDITALHSAIYTQTGLVTYYGPHFSSLGMQNGLGYTIDHLKLCLMTSKPFSINPSGEWSDDRWFEDQENRTFIRNSGHVVINTGSAKGTIIGGNACTFNLLHGTAFMPDLQSSILFIEDDLESKPHHFDRSLQSIIQQPGFDGVRGIVIGRFQKGSGMSQKLLKKIIRGKRELDGIPVIANVDFGHTTPQITFPLGGEAQLDTDKGILKVVRH